MMRRYTNRAEAGRCLAAALPQFRNRPEAISLGLARGGVPVAVAVGAELGIPSGALIVRKLGVPGQPETAFGALAICRGDIVRVINPPFVDRLLHSGITRADLNQVEDRERAELLRRVADYGLPDTDLAGMTVILTDDGVATGFTMLAAVEAVRRGGPAAVVAAVPVGSLEAYKTVAGAADSVICLRIPGNFRAVGNAYLDFEQVSDAEVARLQGPRSPGGC
ncbi:phosphoribosyltransferase [Paenarthrobacter sp. PH39-S1]|uniref:phosphoribosyltransferase n=1 Tax=Micrococcaceae TaxID=1268 RepID=UPI0024BAF260|nr:phosphoribosyltransferase family protein [Paenarthrobacter sp. PH39-S1]MDJ0358346.1 phosphoribosyltransferase family protein [Paenarthrobacter sp. PH39-S1]